MMKTTRGTLAIPNDPTPWVIVQPNDEKEFCVLWLQGWKSTIESHLERIERLARKTDVTFAMCEYAGHGSHPVPVEKTTREQQFNEALAAYDKLSAMGYKHIIVIGASFGGYLTALLSSARRPYSVVLRVPAIYDDAEFSRPFPERNARDQNYQNFKQTVTPESDLNALNAVRKFEGPVYVIEQEIDSVIPKNIPRSYFAVAKRGNYLVVPGTEHSPNMQENPGPRYEYIEQTIASTVRLSQLETTL